MKNTTLLFAMLLAAVLIGCGKQEKPRHIVILPDISGSIDRQALHEAFQAIGELVGQLHRGDRIAIIPILGDAEAEASGRIIRYEVPTNRQAYDSDLKAFRQRLKNSLTGMEAEALAHPGAKTDILGSVALAGQEFEAVSEQFKRLLLILSDFIQEDREIDFRKDRRAESLSAAQQLAMQTARANVSAFKGTSVYLGLLRSNEYIDMGTSRRKAIQGFWIEYFKSCGGQTSLVNDGPGMIGSSIVAK